MLVAGVDGLSEALNIIAEGGNYIASTLNDPKYLGDVTIQVAREAAAKKEVAKFVDAGSTLVTFKNVADFPREGLFAEYRPQVLDQ